MTKLKHHERHAKDGRETHSHLYICGEIRGLEWAFDDISHALMNAQMGNFMTLCPQCLAVAMKAFAEHGEDI